MLSGGPMTSAPCVLHVLWGEGASLSRSCPSGPGADGGDRGAAAPGSVLQKLPFCGQVSPHSSILPGNSEATA